MTSPTNKNRDKSSGANEGAAFSSPMSEITAAGQGEMAPCKQSAAPAVTNKQAAYPRQAHNPNEYSGIGETVSAPSVATSVTVANSDGVSSLDNMDLISFSEPGETIVFRSSAAPSAPSAPSAELLQFTTNILAQRAALEGDSDHSTAIERLVNESRVELDRIEEMVKDMQYRLQLADDMAEVLQSAAHLAVPDPGFVLPSRIMKCFECYKMGIKCDSLAVCRHCFENKKVCARWRCSVQHVLGNCPTIGCTLPHEWDGFLIDIVAIPGW